VVPPGIGIVHQVNLEYLARGVHRKQEGAQPPIYYPDTLVGTDSHTTMINGIGVVGWGVGGIEAEAGMLGQPMYFLTPDVVGVHLKGRLHPACTATDLVLTVTELLRKAKVVGKFVEFFGEGTASLKVPDRATIANMAPEYGATMGFFPVDERTIDYFRGTGRTAQEIEAFAAYFKAQGLFGIPKAGDIDYSEVLQLDLSSIYPSLAGPKRPQDRIDLDKVKSSFTSLFSKPVAESGFAKRAADLGTRYRSFDGTDIGNGDVLIAAITSCTNTSNPGVLLAAGLLAKKAVELGLKVKPHVKTSLAPGSRVVTEYLTKAGLLPYLEKLGFAVAAYGCTTCIGNAGPLAPAIEEAITKNDLVCAAVLSGNRNFEARIHPNIRANFLASPPLVVAYAIAGTMLRDFRTEPLGIGKDGKPVFIGHVWPSAQEVDKLMSLAMDAPTFRRLYADLANANPLWKKVSAPGGEVYSWPPSTYIAEPPFFKDFSMSPGAIGEIRNAKVLAIFGDSVTTDHISPAGSIKPTSPAGIYLQEHDVAVADFNSYGARRGNHEVMMRGTFANVRIKNLMLPGTEGGFTLFENQQLPIYEAAMRHIASGTPTVVFGGEEYGTGSSRDWAAKGTQLLGVRAVIARSFERIHRSNLVGMGVMPLQFLGSDSAQSLGLKGDETFDVLGLDDLRPQQELTLVITRAEGTRKEIRVRSRIDTAIEVDYYKHGGILPYVLRELMRSAGPAKAKAA
jgi:aconitate hydratase